MNNKKPNISFDLFHYHMRNLVHKVSEKRIDFSNFLQTCDQREFPLKEVRFRISSEDLSLLSFMCKALIEHEHYYGAVTGANEVISGEEARAAHTMLLEVASDLLSQGLGKPCSNASSSSHDNHPLLAPMRMAASVGHNELLGVLLDDQAGSLELQDGNGMSVLHYAIESNQLKTVKFLVEQGANIMESERSIDYHFPIACDVLNFAKLFGKKEMIQYLEQVKLVQEEQKELEDLPKGLIALSEPVVLKIDKSKDLLMIEASMTKELEGERGDPGHLNHQIRLKAGADQAWNRSTGKPKVRL